MNNLVNLNVNPCKMCMPMGAVSALSGIRGCMTILHGSQGCATYIRRHMATHYNEPIDIASSSLTEEGTVFGGEANLLKGLDNLIKLYSPELIGVCTTCLAETIGEDVKAIVKKFYDRHPDTDARIVSVASPGYGGTQNEGWFAALRALLEQTAPDKTPSERINIVTPQISPADTRWLKGFLAEAGVACVLLPDISDSLDGAVEKHYKRLKTDGTSVSDIARAAGARLTIEFSEYANAANSPAEYLYQTHGVPFVKLPLPVGLRGMDAFLRALADVGATVKEAVARARGRYLDAMVDSQKYCARVRAAIFGEPDFVTALVRLCCENGMLPAVIATASVSEDLKRSLARATRECRDFRLAEEISVVDDSDFAEIERLCRERKANLLIGSSDARRISHKLRIPLIRCAFPIHDHVGGQRVRILGFEGSLNLLDQAANAMLERTETRFRGALYRRFFKGDARQTASPGRRVPRVADKTAMHPCFNEAAHENARAHLPVAAACNVRCNYCVRGFDCANENRPGVASAILTPREALARYIRLKELLPRLSVVGIAGPGDALASFPETRETLRLIRAHDPDAIFCVATNGLMLPQYAGELKRLGVSHAVVTVNAVAPHIGARIYGRVRYMGKTYTGVEGASVLLANQLAGIKMLVDDGIAVKVNCVALKGINDGHIHAITREAARLGAFMTNIMPHIPLKGSVFEALDGLTHEELAALRARCGENIKQMTHCRQCRADAAGTLGADMDLARVDGAPPAKAPHARKGEGAARGRGAPSDARPGRAWGVPSAPSARGIAVFADKSAALCGFFDADRFLIFEKRADAWTRAREIAFERIVPSASAQTRKRTEALLPLLGACKILAGGALLGIPYTVFDRAGFHIFEIGGVRDEIFDGILADIRRADSARGDGERPVAEAVPAETDVPGVYALDLIALLRERPELSSKKALAGFLENTPFSELRLTCKHVPPWIENSGKYDIQTLHAAEGVKRLVIARRC
ncbi:MAG: radical SAM protein [Clostridiales Family XIII bacterium]|jgi:nitrogenase cofactor biosynthesis protein NifB|nr:radical SAM protein [Clostridiales Family XIII bacterium]